MEKDGNFSLHTIICNERQDGADYATVWDCKEGMLLVNISLKHIMYTCHLDLAAQSWIRARVAVTAWADSPAHQYEPRI